LSARIQLSLVDIYGRIITCLQGAQQQTRRMLLQQFIDLTDGLTDGRCAVA